MNLILRERPNHRSFLYSESWQITILKIQVFINQMGELFILLKFNNFL